jgi:hypothetical protein
VQIRAAGEQLELVANVLETRPPKFGSAEAAELQLRVERIAAVLLDLAPDLVE